MGIAQKKVGIMSNFIFFINDSLQVVIFLLGYGISLIGLGIGLFFAILRYFNLIIILYLLYILIFNRNKKPMLYENLIEVIYCLLAPAIYLSIVLNTDILYFSTGNTLLENSIFHNILAWIAISVYWIIRIIPNINNKYSNVFTFLSKLSVYFCFLVLTLFIWKDYSFLLSRFTESGQNSSSTYSKIFDFLFYIIPYFIGLRRLVQNQKEDYLEKKESFVFFKRVQFISFFLVGLLLFNLFQKTDIGIRLRLKSLNADINNYSQEYKVDRTLIKAIIYTNYKHYLNPIKLLAEYVALGLWALDDYNHLGWAKKFSVSVGVTQIQPTTAQKAILLGMLNYKNQSYYFSKQYRAAIVELTPEWKIKDATLKIKTMHLDTIPPFQIALELVDPSNNIQYCAYTLYLFQSQWNSANYDISEKPEILASLYQIGFNKSIPKPNPVSNEYGKMVKEAYELLKIEEMREDKEALNLMLPR